MERVMTLPCKFCSKDTAYVPLQVSKRKFDVHYCYNCSAEYVSYSDTSSVHIYTIINNKMYRWSVNSITEQSDYGTIWYVGEPGIPGERPNRKMKMLKSFDTYLPNITPENIVNKLRFMLLFL
jgi:hypothetical protein